MTIFRSTRRKRYTTRSGKIDQHLKGSLDINPGSVRAECKATEVFYPSPETGTDLDKAEIDSLESHEVDKPTATVRFRVKRANGERSYESENSLQKEAPERVYTYWNTVGGRDKVTKLKEYHVFCVLGQTDSPQANDIRYQVQWVGFDCNESTWEPHGKVEEIAPEALAKFQNNLKLQTKAKAKRNSRVKKKPASTYSTQKPMQRAGRNLRSAHERGI